MSAAIELRRRGYDVDLFDPGPIPHPLADAKVLFYRLCPYCDSWDGNLWIDHDPDRPGLFVAAGDSRHAFKFTPVLGKLIADVLERKPNEHAKKFAWRLRGELVTEDARYIGE